MGFSLSIKTKRGELYGAALRFVAFGWFLGEN